MISRQFVTRSRMHLVCRAVAFLLLVALSAPLPMAAGQLATRPASSAERSGVMTNADVISLVAAGLNESIVAQKVRTAPSTDFDTSVAGLKALKAENVPDEVIHAMLESASSSAGYSNSDDPTAMHQPGVYLQYSGNDGQAHMLMLEHTEAVGAKQSTSALSTIGGGAAMVGVPILSAMNGKTHVRAELNGPRSPVRISDANPNFYVYVAEDTTRFGGNEFSVRDFTLLRFRTNDKVREVEISVRPGGYAGEMGGSSGIEDKARQPTTTQKIKPGIYLVKLMHPLKPGEYAFEHLLDGVFYDFGVNEGR